MRINKLLIVIALCAPIFSHACYKKLECETGPVNKQFGGASWLVYSCNDDKSLVVVSDTGNPAMPFYFSFHYKDGDYTLVGQGQGDKASTAATFEELKKLTNNQIMSLVKETRALTD